MTGCASAATCLLLGLSRYASDEQVESAVRALLDARRNLRCALLARGARPEDLDRLASGTVEP